VASHPTVLKDFKKAVLIALNRHIAGRLDKVSTILAEQGSILRADRYGRPVFRRTEDFLQCFFII
jgi:hypothetical protein